MGNTLKFGFMKSIKIGQFGYLNPKMFTTVNSNTENTAKREVKNS